MKEKVFINSTLAKNEKILFTYDLHWIVWLRVFLLFIVGLLTLPILIGVIFLIAAIFSILSIKGTEYGITDKKIVGKTGFIFRRNIDLRLNKIESVILDQGIFGRMFGYGHIVFNGTGSGKNGFLFVQNPMLVKNQINQVLEDIEEKNKQ